MSSVFASDLIQRIIFRIIRIHIYSNRIAFFILNDTAMMHNSHIKTWVTVNIIPLTFIPFTAILH